MNRNHRKQNPQRPRAPDERDAHNPKGDIRPEAGAPFAMDVMKLAEGFINFIAAFLSIWGTLPIAFVREADELGVRYYATFRIVLAVVFLLIYLFFIGLIRAIQSLLGSTPMERVSLEFILVFIILAALKRYHTYKRDDRDGIPKVHTQAIGKSRLARLNLPRLHQGWFVYRVAEPILNVFVGLLLLILFGPATAVYYWWCSLCLWGEVIIQAEKNRAVIFDHHDMLFAMEWRRKLMKGMPQRQHHEPTFRVEQLLLIPKKSESPVIAEVDAPETIEQNEHERILS